MDTPKQVGQAGRMAKPTITLPKHLQPVQHQGLAEWKAIIEPYFMPPRIGDLSAPSSELPPVKSVFETYFPGIDAIEEDAMRRPEHYKELRHVIDDLKAKREVNQRLATELIYKFLSAERPPAQKAKPLPSKKKAKAPDPDMEYFEDQDYGELIDII